MTPGPDGGAHPLDRILAAVILLCNLGTALVAVAVGIFVASLFVPLGVAIPLLGFAPLIILVIAISLVRSIAKGLRRVMRERASIHTAAPPATAAPPPSPAPASAGRWWRSPPTPPGGDTWPR